MRVTSDFVALRISSQRFEICWDMSSSKGAESMRNLDDKLEEKDRSLDFAHDHDRDNESEDDERFGNRDQDEDIGEQLRFFC